MFIKCESYKDINNLITNCLDDQELYTNFAHRKDTDLVVSIRLG